MYAERDVERWVAEEPKGEGRTPFQRDRARVLHSAALRRLAGKTQVVVALEDDFPRTRLTHSLECAQIGREVGQALGADPDLVDAACLAHDLGHPPYGHNGEVALDEIARAAGGFEGNAQSFRLLTRVEAKVRGAGLNLTRAALDAATKYPWPRREGGGKYGVYDDDRAVFDWVREDAAEGRTPIEAQVMDWADDVAYSVHDLEDGIHGGHVDLAALDVDAGLAAARETYLPGAEPEQLREQWGVLTADPRWHPADEPAVKALTSHLIGRFCRAAVDATRAAHGDGPLTRYAAELVVPADVRAQCALLKAVALVAVMRDPVHVRLQSEQRELLHALAAALLDQAPDCLGAAERAAWADAADDAGRLRAVVDQIAALTDASAAALLARLARR